MMLSCHSWFPTEKNYSFPKLLSKPYLQGGKMKFISIIVLICFILTGIPAKSYAGILDSNNLRRKSATKEGNSEEMLAELTNTPIVVFHRGGGASEGLPRNTLKTFDLALEHGAKSIEFDILLCNKGEIIVAEDSFLQKKGLDLDNLDFNALRNIDVGNEKYGRQNIPSLAEVLDLVRGKDVELQIHIKGNNKNIVSGLVDLLKKKNMVNNVLVTCFDRDFLKELRGLNKEVKIGWLVLPENWKEGKAVLGTDWTKIFKESSKPVKVYTDEEIQGIIKEANGWASVLILHAYKIGKETVEAIKKANLSSGAWGVADNLELARKLTDFGVQRLTLDNAEQWDKGKLILPNQSTFWENENKKEKIKPVGINKFAEEIIEQIRPNSNILSIGAGPAGFDEMSFAKAGHKVVATDFVEDSVNELKERIKKEGVVNLEAKVQDITKHFNFPDESFDVVYSHLSLNFMTDAEFTDALKEIFRVLKPGGSIYLLAMSVKDARYGEGELVKDGKDSFLREGKLVHYFSEEYLKEKFGKFEIKEEDIVMGQRTFYPQGREQGFIQLKAKKPVVTVSEQLEKIYEEKGPKMDDYYVPSLVVVDSKGEPVAKVKKGDVVVFANHRTDRSLETLLALTDPNFNKQGNRFDTENLGLNFVPFTGYDKEYFKAHGIQAAFTSQFTLPPYQSIVEVLHQAGVVQGYFTESDKGQHVTYFFAGQRNLDYASLGIKASIVPSERVEDKNKDPRMKYDEITDNVINYLNEIKGIPKKKVIVVNLPVDIQGHNIKGDRERAKATVLAADEAAGRIRKAVLAQKGVYIETSDHGNIEKLATLDEKGMPLSDKYGLIPFDQHTTNPVNFIIDGLGKDIKLKQGKGLSNIAATLLEVLGIPKPEEMNESLLSDYQYQEIQGPIVLLIRDGWGVNKFENKEAEENDGIALAQPPVFLDLVKNCPHTTLKAHGDAVGLPDYQMGDSDNGHRVIGTGFNPPTLYKQIIDQIEDGSFFENPVLLQAFELAKKEKRNIHIMGLYSSGGIHSDNRYFLALMEMAKKMNFGGKVNIWPILDGRDVMTRIPTENGIFYLKQIQDKISELNATNIQLAGAIGRNFAMDRDAINRDREADKKEKLAETKTGTEADKLRQEVFDFREEARKIWEERFKPAYRLWVNGEGIPVSGKFDGDNVKERAKELGIGAKDLKDFFDANSRFFKAVGGETAYRYYLDMIWEWYKLKYGTSVTDKKLALVVHSSFFRNAGAVDALKEIIKFKPDNLESFTKLCIYGEGADKLAALFDDSKDVIAANTISELIPKLSKWKIDPEVDMVVLRPIKEKIDLNVRIELNVKQVAYSEKTISTIAVAKAIEVLVGMYSAGGDYSLPVSTLFHTFYNNMKDNEVISAEPYKTTVKRVSLTVDLPPIELAQGVNDITKNDADLISKFIDSFI